MQFQRRFLTWVRKVIHLPHVLQGIRDARKAGQVTYSTIQMAVLTFLNSLTMAPSNRTFFDVHVTEPAVKRLAGLRWQRAPSQDTFEYVLPRFCVSTVVEAHAQIISTLRRNKVFPRPVVVAVDATEIPLPDGDYENCGVRHHKEAPDTYYYKAVVVSLVGCDVPPLILGMALHNGENELSTAKDLLRYLFRRHRGFIDVVVADRLYFDHKLINELKTDFQVDVVIEAKEKSHVLEEGLALLEADQPGPTWATFRDRDRFRFREIPDVGHVWEGLDVPRLGFIEAHQDSPWPDLRRKRTKRTRYILTTLPSGQADLVHQILRDRWWIESTNWDLEHRWMFKHLPTTKWTGVEAYLQFTAMAYTLLQCFLHRRLGGLEQLGMTLTSFCRKFAAGFLNMDHRRVTPLTRLDTG